MMAVIRNAPAADARGVSLPARPFGVAPADERAVLVAEHGLARVLLFVPVEAIAHAQAGAPHDETLTSWRRDREEFEHAPSLKVDGDLLGGAPAIDHERDRTAGRAGGRTQPLARGLGPKVERLGRPGLERRRGRASARAPVPKGDAGTVDDRVRGEGLALALGEAQRLLTGHVVGEGE